MNKVNVPQLRFPEFDGEWENKKFGKLYSFHITNSLSRDKLNYENGSVYNIHYGDIHTKFQSHFYLKNENVPYVNDDIDLSKIKEDSYCENGDIIIADASEDYADIGKSIELIDINNSKLISGLHTFLARPISDKTALGFTNYLLKSWNLRKQIMTIAQGTKVLSLSTGRVSNLKLNIPSLPEQQKIASFLSSVDEKIQQLSRKKELVEQYKKGVMQQLFSSTSSEQRSGKLRFKDENGKNYPDWVEKILDDVIHFFNGKGHEKNIDENGEYVVVNSKFVSTDGKIRKFCNTQISPLSKGEIVMVMSDVPNGKALAKCYLIEEDNIYTLNQRICGLKARNGNSNEFLIYLLNRNKYYLSFDSGVGQTNLKKDEVLNCPLFIPTSLKEQQKIANFLSNIDVKIENTNQEIKQMQHFKKGLLQQMFV